MMASSRDFDIFKSKAFAGETKHDSTQAQNSVLSSSKLPSDTHNLNGYANPFTQPFAEINEKKENGPGAKGPPNGVKEPPSGVKESPHGIADGFSITPNVLEARVSRKHWNKNISEKHTPIPAQSAMQKSQPTKQHELGEIDSSDDDVENKAKPPYESARKRADKAAFSEW